MKSCIKRSEIIEQFHLLSGDPSPISIVKMSILEYSKFHKIYVCEISRKDGFQVLTVSLIFGWTHFTLYGLHSSDDVVQEYIEVLNSSSKYLLDLVTGKMS